MNTRSESTFRVGDVLNEKWVILSFVGKGGMGEVYRAHQLNLERDVAIKIISPSFLEELSDNEYEAEACVGRFHREVKVMAQVRHPNILQIHDYGSAPARLGNSPIEYIVMEYVPGGNLRSTMSAEGFHPDEDRMREWILSYFIPLLDGVSALHEQGVIHRDLKPENVLLDGKAPKIADFGLARSRCVSPLTQSMDMKGTPPYMSPEHFLDLKRTDERADVYSLGKILYETIYGKISSDQIPFKKVSPPAANTLFFQRLARIVENATDEDRNLRTPSVQVMREKIEETLRIAGTDHVATNGLPMQQKPWWRAHVLPALMVIILSTVIGTGLSLFYAQVRAPEPASPGNHVKKPLSHQLLPAPDLPSEIKGIDDDVMRLIPAGTIVLPQGFGANSGKEIKVNSFYLDEMQVTNHQYVEFLNRALPRIKVENNVVYGDGEVWLMLGEVLPGYEPIIYRDSRFHIQNAAHASSAVLRVSGYGASAYVHFYERRLPTEIEWLHVAAQGGNVPSRSGDVEPSASSSGMHMMGRSKPEDTRDRSEDSSAAGDGSTIPLPVITQKPNRLGIRGMDGKVSEWALSGTESTKATYVLMGGIMAPPQDASSLPRFVPRQPWESFMAVGFRCALSLSNESGAGDS